MALIKNSSSIFFLEGNTGNTGFKAPDKVHLVVPRTFPAPGNLIPGHKNSRKETSYGILVGKMHQVYLKFARPSAPDQTPFACYSRI